MNYLKKTKEGAERIAKNSEKVKIDFENIEKLAEKWAKTKIKTPVWDTQHHFAGLPEKTAFYFFILDSINFSFFPDKNQQKWHLRRNNKKINGYLGLALALKQTAKNYSFFEIDFWKTLEEKTFKELLNGEGKMPLLKQRLNILKESAGILKKRFGNIAGLIKQANNSAAKMVWLLVKYFPSFRDISVYKDQKTYFLKRAQIFTADLYGALNGKGLGFFKDIDELTAFADYKVPQILNSLEILIYSKDLEKTLKSQKKIEKDSQEEIEIRSNTIWAVELLKEGLTKKGRKLNSFQIDWILWNKAQQTKMKLPYHRTRTIFY